MIGPDKINRPHKGHGVRGFNRGLFPTATFKTACRCTRTRRCPMHQVDPKYAATVAALFKAVDK